MLNTAAHAQYEGSGFSGKGIIVWGNDAFNQAANPPATNNWWKEFKDFILDSEAGLGGTIYKDCTGWDLSTNGAAFSAAISHFATQADPIRVSPGCSMIWSGTGCTDNTCGVSSVQAILDYITNIDATTRQSIIHNLGHLEIWVDFEPHLPGQMSPIYFPAIKAIRNMIIAYNQQDTTGLKVSLSAFLAMKLHSHTPVGAAGGYPASPTGYYIPCELPDGSTQTMYVSDCMQQHYLAADAASGTPAGSAILMAYRNVACYKDVNTSLCPDPDGCSSDYLQCWDPNHNPPDMVDCYGMVAWGAVFAEGAMAGGTTLSLAIETNPEAPNAYETSFGQPNLNGNIGWLDSQVSSAIQTLKITYQSVLNTNPIVINDYTHYFCFINKSMPYGGTSPCPQGVATHCNPTASFQREDLNYDGVVDQLDLDIMYAAAGSCPGDLSGDGVVDGEDLGLMISLWGPCIP